MKSKALDKSANNIVASSFFFARTPLRIRRIVKICEVVDLFLRKSFWFFQSMFSILGSMRLLSRALYILATMYFRVIVLSYSEVAILREEENVSLCQSVYCVLIIWAITVPEQYVVELPGLPYFWGYFIKPCCFFIFNFSLYRVEFFLCKLS